MSLQPTDLKLISPDCLQIEWSDGATRHYPIKELRESCPCATCREKRRAPPEPTSSLEVISIEETLPLRITKMDAVGNYAYSIHFSDGHNTGLFTIESLRELGTVAGEDS